MELQLEQGARARRIDESCGIAVHWPTALQLNDIIMAVRTSWRLRRPSMLSQ